MPSFLQSAADWLGKQFLEREAVDVTVSRTAGGATATIDLDAVPLHTDCTADETGEIIHQHRWRDWRVKAADYNFTGDPEDMPARGDLITYVTADGVTHVYEVLPPSDKELPYHAFDPQYRWLRVHSKER